MLSQDAALEERLESDTQIASFLVQLRPLLVAQPKQDLRLAVFRDESIGHTRHPTSTGPEI